MFERVKQWLSGSTQRTVAPVVVGGGRQSVDTEQSFLSAGLSFLAPISGDDYWRNYNLDANTLDRVSPLKLIELLADLSPDVSKALWDFLLFMNPGWEAKAYKPGSDTVDKAAQKALDAFLGNLHASFSLANTLPIDVIIASLHIGVFLRGAFLAELVLDASGRIPIDIATPDPKTIIARRRVDPVRGQVWEIGQWQNGTFVTLDRPTVCYIPVHPLPGRPYGRALAAPALFSTLFLLGMLHDLRRVIAQQGYPRLDISIDFEKLQPPDGLTSDEVEAWAKDAVKEIETAYAKLQPDDAYIHHGAISVNRPVGAVDASSLGKVDDIISTLERFSVRALKSMPLLFGMNETVAETHANRQWEVHAAGTKSLQHLSEALLSRELTLALQVQGIQAEVKFRFAELRAAELLRDAQVESLKLKNARTAYDNGLVSQDEQALMALGKDKADQPEPRSAKALPPSAPEATNVNADPGSERANESEERIN